MRRTGCCLQLVAMRLQRREALSGCTEAADSEAAMQFTRAVVAKGH